MKKAFVAVPVFLLALALGAGPSGPLAGPDSTAEAPFAYHLRLVHVSGAGSQHGAAVGVAQDDGQPVLLPEYEAWGTPEQLQALAATLGGERADAVTGFFLRADRDGVPRFARPVFIGESELTLEFQARPPFGSDDAHKVLLNLTSKGDAEPLTEAELLVRTDRTVAVACPSVTDGDWLVAAVTLVEQRRLDAQSAEVGSIRKMSTPGLEEPKLLERVEPVYPKGARRTLVSGHVVLEVVLDRHGIPHAPTVVEMTKGCEELAAAAVEAVLQWRYEPARLDGAPVPIHFSVTVQFRLA